MSEPIVETIHGRVRGFQGDDVLAFLGVPYGASTAGEGRFKAPQPPAPWPGIRDAVELAPVAFQSSDRPGARAGVKAVMSEDCLTLNIWTPSLQGARPVVVWFHGGGFISGEAVSAESHGAALAGLGDVVTVNVTHRLGMLGFLHLEEIGGEQYSGSGNAASLDMQLSLEWVRDNIARFGGDPGAVTVHGHSGGGGKTALLASMPGTRGLLHRSVVHGGPPFGFKDHAAATDNAEEALAILGLGPGDLQALADLPIERLMHLQRQLGAGDGPGPNGMRFAPVFGTRELPADPYQMFAAGCARDIEFMTGTAKDESRAAISAFPHYLTDAEMTDGELVERLRPGVDDPNDAETLVERYREILPDPNNGEIFFAVTSDQFTIRSLRLADAKKAGDGQDSWVYLCTANQSSPLRAFHGVQMPLFFNNVDDATPAGSVAPEVGAEFTRFAYGELSLSDSWRSYRRDEPEMLVIDEDGIRSESSPLADRVVAWDGIVVTPRTDPWTTLWE